MSHGVSIGSVILSCRVDYKITNVFHFVSHNNRVSLGNEGLKDSPILVRISALFNNDENLPQAMTRICLKE